MAVAILLLATVSTALLWGHLTGSSRYQDVSLDPVLGMADDRVDAVSFPSNPDNTPGLLQPSMMAETSDTHGEVPLESLESMTERLKAASQSVAQYVSSSYRISLSRANQLTNMAIQIGEAKNVDPLLIMAVIATESSYNPRARSSAGAEGLMQVVTSVHREKYDAFGGEDKAFDPYANISVGTDILNELIQRTGNVRKALKYYSGAANLSSDKGYSARVLAERHRLAIAASGNADSAIELSQRQMTPATFSLEKAADSTGFDDWVVIAMGGDNA